MRINNNVMALNAWRNLFSTTSGLTKSMEKLSSGFRINRAGDDAAGLAISEKMRGQIAGLKAASKNAQDGISLIQTAEGAMNEVHAMLKRMEELAVQAANDTNTAGDRAKLQDEMDQLSQEIARIGGTTEFNTLKLLNGTFESKDIVFHVGANEGQNLRIRIADARSHSLGLAPSGRFDVAATVTNAAGDFKADAVYTVGKNASDQYALYDENGLQVATSANGLTYTSANSDTLVFTDPVISGSVTMNSTADGATGTATVTNDGLEAGVYQVSGTDLVDQNGTVVASWNATATNYQDAAGNVLFDPATGDLSAAGVTQVTIGGVDISTQEAADAALPTIREALETVSTQRSLLGATQNRLEHTISNLEVAAENLQAAESRIRDVDMASEMATFTKHQVLLQAGTAMLAQANSVPQSVLQLLG
ncbi:MAG: flagellin [Candidatus Thermoplasmatota archaeon]|nr:flagellin [Candidatus Thermoplasmatota archaeon]